MPDVLGGLSGRERATVEDELVHFLVSEQADSSGTPVGLDDYQLQFGRRLYHSIGCVACHHPEETLVELTQAGVSAPRSQDDQAVPFGDLARKYTVTALADFIKDPLASRPSGRMPSLGLSDSEARAIAMYLARGQATSLYQDDTPLQKTRGLRYTYFEFGQGDLPTGGNEEFADHFPGDLPENARSFLRVAGTGVTEIPTDALAKRKEQIGFLFTGYLTVVQAGEYTFYTQSDDGSRLYVGNELVVQNDGGHAVQERQGTIRLEAGDHPFRVTYYNGAADGSLAVLFAGPGLAKQAIPASRFHYLGQPMVPLGDEGFVLDAAKARRGADHFARYGCIRCHSVEGVESNDSVGGLALGRLEGSRATGCLGEAPSGRAARYSMGSEERAALVGALARASQASEARSAAEALSLRLNQLNCYACHQRDGWGGPTPERAAYFGTEGEVDLGDEGRLPPHLEKVGAKLQEEWLSEVLTEGAGVRPYMATRMPRFGSENVGHLGTLFGRVDDPNPDDATEPVPLLDTKYGRLLVGTKGMNCITCHTYGPYDSLGVPAIDLTQMGHRLKRSWFRDYLLEPASLRPGTRMPSFFPEGESVNEVVFGGDTERQIQALWGFLQVADASNPPDGLVQGRKEIVAETEAVMYRNFIEGSGPRSIGVGYPEKGNLAFDANAMRLAMIWHGPFIDAARHSSGRGVGFEPPLGHNVIHLPEGPPLAFLPERSASWPETTGKDGGYQFRGYQLDVQRRPTFRYTFRNVMVEDFSEALATELDAELLRTVTLRTRAGVRDLWFRVAVGAEIVKSDGGLYVVDQRLRLSFDSSGSEPPLVREQAGRKELLVPVEFSKGESRIQIKMVW